MRAFLVLLYGLAAAALVTLGVATSDPGSRPWLCGFGALAALLAVAAFAFYDFSLGLTALAFGLSLLAFGLSELTFEDVLVAVIGGLALAGLLVAVAMLVGSGRLPRFVVGLLGAVVLAVLWYVVDYLEGWSVTNVVAGIALAAYGAYRLAQVFRRRRRG